MNTKTLEDAINRINEIDNKINSDKKVLSNALNKLGITTKSSDTLLEMATKIINKTEKK